MDCCDENNKKYDYDLLILGSGSAAFAGAIKASELGKYVGIIEKDTLGGTCVNFGCVPSKTLIRAAETKHRLENSNFSGVKPGDAKIDFQEIMKNKGALVKELQEAKYLSVLKNNKKITHIQGYGKLITNHSIEVDGKVLTSEKILIATGSSTVLPEIPGLNEIDYLTSRTAFDLKALPDRLVVLGGGYVALETAQMFSRLGSKVTIIQRSEIMSHEDIDISKGIAQYLREEGLDVLTNTKVKSISQKGDSTLLHIVKNNEGLEIEADKVLICTGRSPNTANLGLDKVDIKLNKDGTIKVNGFNQTNISNIYAAGDVLDSPALVYTAAYEGNLAIENAFVGNKRSTDFSNVPWVVFSDPQVAGVGLNEKQAQSLNIKYDTSLLSLDNVPRAIAARDTRGFVKLLRKTGTDELIGARILAPEGSELLMELTLMIKYKLPISEIAASLHPYLTLGEAVKLAAQTFDKDIKTLSCCAS